MKIAVSIAGAVVLALVAWSSGGESALLAPTCTPQAHVPVVFMSVTQGSGTATCQCGAPSWYYTVRLTGANGQVLRQTNAGPLSGTKTVATGSFYCYGWSLHSFLYINVGGAGKSHTSSNTTCT